MRIEQLRYIADIAETGSLTATAQRRFVTQQAVSKTIKQLEKELDAEVLIRTRTGVTFTEIGKELVAFAQSVLAEEAVFRKNVSQIKHTERKMTHNDMHIASTSSISNLLLPILISNPKMQENNVTIHVNTCSTYEEVIERVNSKISDLGLITVNEMEISHLIAPHQKELEAEVIMKDKMIALMDRRYYTGESLNFPGEIVTKNRVLTLYNIFPMERFRGLIQQTNVICSSDADFHRDMMEKTGAITLMSVTSYHQHFNHKRYVPLVFDTDFSSFQLLHVAVYRKSAKKYMDNLLNLLRREMVFEGLKSK